MACFLVPAAEAVVTTVLEKSLESKEMAVGEAVQHEKYTSAGHIPFSRKLKWLNNMLWGGSALLAFEHVWHGEVVPFFPFLTAAQDPASTAEMLHEMSTVGVGMAGLVSLAWAGMLAVTHILEKRLQELPAASETE